MLTADKVKMLTEFGPTGLAVILDRSGYSMCSFKTAKFLGITNGGQFCYKVTFHDEGGLDEEAEGKVFITYDHANDSIKADF